MPPQAVLRRGRRRSGETIFRRNFAASTSIIIGRDKISDSDERRLARRVEASGIHFRNTGEVVSNPMFAKRRSGDERFRRQFRSFAGNRRKVSPFSPERFRDRRSRAAKHRKRLHIQEIATGDSSPVASRLLINLVFSN